jgi:hypothetical protein
MLQPIGGGPALPHPPLYTSGTSPNYRTPLGNLTPTDFLHQALSFIHTSYPDYDAVINGLMDPLQKAQQEKLKALGIQTQFQKDLANKNAELQREQAAQVHKRAIKTIVNSLTGRGMINSGDRSYNLDFENQTFERMSKLSANQLLAYLMSLEDMLKNAALDADAQYQQGLIGAQAQAHAQYSPNPHYDPWAPKAGGPNTTPGY